MQIHEISKQVKDLSQAWEEFKSLNDQREAKIEKKSSIDPLDEIKLQKINDFIENIETSMARPKINHKSSPSESPEYKEAFKRYLKSGEDENNSLRALTSENDGGYLITGEMKSLIDEKIQEYSPMRSLARVDKIASDYLDVLYDKNNMDSHWVGEQEMRADTSTPELVKSRIFVHELYAQPKATQKLLDDSALDIEKWIASNLAESFAKAENFAFINGDGVGKPFGLLHYAQNGNKKIDVIEEQNISYDSLMSLIYYTDDKYLTNAKFLMNRTTIQALRMLKDENSGRYLWSPSIEAGQPDTLFGFPVVRCNEMPLYQSDNPIIAFGDFKQAYHIIDRENIGILVDPYTDKPFVKFYSTKRVGADVVDHNAIKLVKLKK